MAQMSDLWKKKRIFLGCDVYGLCQERIYFNPKVRRHYFLLILYASRSMKTRARVQDSRTRCSWCTWDRSSS